MGRQRVLLEIEIRDDEGLEKDASPRNAEKRKQRFTNTPRSRRSGGRRK